MKKITNTNNTNFLKKIFIKLCRILGFEIIDQANFRSPTLKKSLEETLSIQGKKSITIPLGQIDIKRKVAKKINRAPRVSISLFLTKLLIFCKIGEFIFLKSIN